MDEARENHVREAVRKGFPYIIRDKDGTPAKLFDYFHDPDKPGKRFTDLYLEYERKDGLRIQIPDKVIFDQYETILHHPAKSCVRITFHETDPESGDALERPFLRVEVNHNVCHAKGWEPVDTFYLVRSEWQEGKDPPEFISRQIIRTVIHYVDHGFLFVAR